MAIFTQRQNISVELCNHPEKVMDYLESILTQEQIAEMELNIIPKLSAQEIATEIFAIGNKVKLIGIENFANAVQVIDSSTLSNALEIGTEFAINLMNTQSENQVQN